MRYSLRLLVWAFLLFSIRLHGQVVRQEFVPQNFSPEEIEVLRRGFGNNKEIPPQFELPILIALSYYPELRDIKIHFKVKRNRSPLMSMPGIWSAIFSQPEHRTYFVIISSHPERFLEHIQFSKLPLNAQVGVMGHELSHVSEFTQRGFFGLVGIFLGSFSGKWVDHFEYQTDRLTIDHGLGYQLLSWSQTVRSRLHISKWFGVDEIDFKAMEELDQSNRERYMNPSTIRSIMASHPLYSDIYGHSCE